jgi:tropomyosin-1
VEGDLQRAEERANAGESKIVDLEEELRTIGENLKALEVKFYIIFSLFIP